MLFMSICQKNEWSLGCLYKGEGEPLPLACASASLFRGKCRSVMSLGMVIDLEVCVCRTLTKSRSPKQTFHASFTSLTFG